MVEKPVEVAQKSLQELMSKEMNRREFLAHVGAGALAVVGISGLIKTLTNYSSHRHYHVSGYSSSSYGGSSKK